MCGIAGILRIHNPNDGPPPHPLEAIPEAWLDVLDDSIMHRGPDGEGRFRDRAIRADGLVVDLALVHRRLSIIDHEGGHQPMVHDGEHLRPDLTYARGQTPILAHELCLPSEHPDLVAVAFNGCIYNHRDLRRELESEDRRFETGHSDTETLVHGWRAWGNLLPSDKLDGMYAAIVWDRQAFTLAGMRDLCGEKPLYDARLCNHNVLCLASSSAAIPRLHRMNGPDTGGIHPLYITPWFSHGAGDGPGSFGDEQFERGEVRTLWIDDEGGWDFEDTRPVTDITTRPADQKRKQAWPSRAGPTPSIDDLDAMIGRAVASRLDTDTGVALLLSGGIDSGLIAAHLQKIGAPTRAITVRMPSADYDESDDARQIAEHVGIGHTILEVGAQPAEDLVRLIEQLGLPFGDSSLLPSYWAFKAAGEHAKVVLTGDGGDELFAGYERHMISVKGPLFRLAACAIPSPLLAQQNPPSKWSKLARLGRAARGEGYADLTAIFDHGRLKKLLPKSTLPPCVYPLDRGFRQHQDGALMDLDSYLPEDLLRKTDTASMAVPVEARAPLLAPELFWASRAIPFEQLTRGGRKGLLKEVARRHLPDHIVDRPKRGFAIPIGDWFRSDYGGMRQLLHDHLGARDPFPLLTSLNIEINSRFVRRMLREHDAAGAESLNPWHGRDHSQRLYLLLVLSIWSKWRDRIQRETDDGSG